jgi:phage shock protein A
MRLVREAQEIVNSRSPGNASMGIFDRLGKAISSNMDALLDKAEDPRKSIELLIEQMKEQLVQGRQQVVESIAAEKQLRRKAEELGGQIDKWQRRAELALEAGDEALAREALLRKKKIAADREQVEGLRAQQRGRALQLKDDLELAKKKLRELEARKGTIAVQVQQARAGGGAEGLGASGGGPTPFDEMERMEEKLDREQLEAEGLREAQEELARPDGASLSDDELEEKFSHLEGGSANGASSSTETDGVEDELRALRTKLRIK